MPAQDFRKFFHISAETPPQPPPHLGKLGGNYIPLARLRFGADMRDARLRGKKENGLITGHDVFTPQIRPQHAIVVKVKKRD